MHSIVIYFNKKYLTAILIQDISGQTALLIAACSGHAPFVSALLQHPDIDPNICDHRQVSPLVTSILSGQSHVTRVLLQHDNTDVNMVDGEGNTPLMIGIK